jgi:hypothetical protein
VAERTAERLLEKSKLPPGTHPRLIAEALGIEVGHRKLPAGLLGLSIPGEKKIVVSPSGYSPRDAMTTAHEMAERLVSKMLPDPHNHEAFCDRIAAAILLPRAVYLPQLREAKFDLAVLRRTWRFASWEVLGLRVVDLVPDALCRSWVNGEPKPWRHQKHVEVMTVERVAVTEAMKHGKGRAIVGDRLTLAWRLPARGARSRAISVCIPERLLQAL